MMKAKAYIVNGKWGIVQALALTIYYSLFALFAVPAQAAFEDKGTGARGTALGDTYAVLGDDVLSLAYNPASLARVNQKQVTTEYAKIMAGLSDGSNLAQSYLAYGQPVSWGGTLAASWKQFSLDDLYKERTLAIGYGEWLTPRIAIGGALKQLYHSFGVPSIVVDNGGNVQSGTPSFFTRNGNSNTAYSSDIGMLYRWTSRHTLGISVQDLNEPNIALSSTDHEIVPRTFRIALSYEKTRHLIFAGALQTRQSLSNQNDTIFTGSAERTWDLVNGDHLALRGSLANGSREFRQVALGGGYQMTSLGFDYAFVFNTGGITIGDTSGTHRFSMSYRFGPKGTPTKVRSAPKPKRPKTPKMPQGYEHKEVVTVPSSGMPVKGPTPVVMPREAEITITSEDLTPEAVTAPAPLKAADVSIDLIFDADFDGVSDEADHCADTPAGSEVDRQGCAPYQVDHRGNPLPRKVHVEFISLDEVEHGR